VFSFLLLFLICVCVCARVGCYDDVLDRVASGEEGFDELKFKELGVIQHRLFWVCLSWWVMTGCLSSPHTSEVCHHPHCVFKLQGEVNSVKNTAINMWLNDGVYWQWKNYMFRPIAAIIRL